MQWNLGQALCIPRYSVPYSYSVPCAFWLSPVGTARYWKKWHKWGDPNPYSPPPGPHLNLKSCLAVNGQSPESRPVGLCITGPVAMYDSQQLIDLETAAVPNTRHHSLANCVHFAFRVVHHRLPKWKHTIHLSPSARLMTSRPQKRIPAPARMLSIQVPRAKTS